MKNEIQKRVFGAGYPSLPTLTIEEFYQELVDEGKMPGPGSSKKPESLNYMGPTAEQLLGDDLKKEREIETDDPEALKNARDYDDWKDGMGMKTGISIELNFCAKCKELNYLVCVVSQSIEEDGETGWAWDNGTIDIGHFWVQIFLLLADDSFRCDR